MSRRRSKGWRPSTPPGSGRATVEQCEQLHGLLADVLLEAVRLMQSTGKVNRGVLAVAIDFLKMAGIDSPASTAEKVDTLLASMPDFDSMH